MNARIILDIAIKITGLILVLITLIKTMVMTVGAPGYNGFDIYMGIQQTLIFLIGLLLLRKSSNLVKFGIRYPRGFSEVINENNIFALGMKLLGLIITLNYFVGILDLVRFYLTSKVEAFGDVPPPPLLQSPESSALLVINVLLILLGCYLFCDGRMVLKIAKIK